MTALTDEQLYRTIEKYRIDLEWDTFVPEKRESDGAPIRVMAYCNAAVKDELKWPEIVHAPDGWCGGTTLREAVTLCIEKNKLVI